MAWMGVGDINQIIERQDITNALLQKILTELVTTRHRLGYELEQLRTITDLTNATPKQTLELDKAKPQPTSTKHTDQQQTPLTATDQEPPRPF